MEVDANDYANDAMKSFQSRFGHDSNYLSYMDSVENQKQTAISSAKDKYGDECNFQQEIADQINKRYDSELLKQNAAYNDLVEKGYDKYGDDWKKYVSTDPELRDLYQKAYPGQEFPSAYSDANASGAQKASIHSNSAQTENSQRGSLPTQSDTDSTLNKKVPQERGQKPSSAEGEPQNKGIERGQKPTESENKSQGNNSTPRGERPQEASRNASNGTTKRGTPAGSTGGEDSKAPTSSSSNPNDKVSASSNSAKAADDASKAASDQATQNVAPKPNGMGM